MDLPCEFFDEYEHPDQDIEYILENIPSKEVINATNECEESKQLSELFSTLLLNKCECNGLQLSQCSSCSHGSNYVFDKEYRELILNHDQKFPELIYECSDLCTCDSKICQNRLAQYGPRKFLKIVDSEQYCSKGLITTEDIPRGAFICEYAGELLTMREARNILRENEINLKMNYVLFLKESCLLPSCVTNNVEAVLTTIVNPTKKGNIGRYLNHSCEPNCQIISVRIDSPIPKVCFFSKQRIKAGEEICFSYCEGVDIDHIAYSKIPCLCHSKNCIKYLPISKYT